MSASEFTFGVEIETHVPAATVAIGHYHHGLTQQLAGLEGWETSRDCSIQAPPGREGCEFVSPILRGAEGLAKLVKAIATINALGAKVNASCGVHVHVGWDGDEAELDRLINLVARHEKAIYATTGTKSRESGRYCRGIRRYGNKQAAKTANTSSRYHVLNLTNLTTGRQRTVEFRAFSGSTDAVKILGWVRLCLALVEKAKVVTRPAAWTLKQTAATSPVKRAGEGQTEVARLMYAIGWTRGDSPRVYGWFDADGAADVKVTKKEFFRLAAKYDAE
jgi:hypothetical protein